MHKGCISSYLLRWFTMHFIVLIPRINFSSSLLELLLLLLWSTWARFSNAIFWPQICLEANLHFVVSDNNSTFVWMAVASAPHDRSTDSNIQAILACCSVWIYIRPLEFSQCMLLHLFLQFWGAMQRLCICSSLCFVDLFASLSRFAFHWNELIFYAKVVSY